jgi:nitroreductase
MNVIDALTTRTSINKFDTTKKLTSDDIRYLVDAAMEAPSAYNIQHTRFLAVTSEAAKQALKEIAYGQQKVADAAVTFVVLGDLEGYTLLPDIGKRAVAAGLYDQAVSDRLTTLAFGAYQHNERLARDEAIRSASLAAMALMLAAQEKGWVSGPMIGFDAQKLQTTFNLDARYLPVMLITVGEASPDNWPRKPRLKSNDVLQLDAQPNQIPAFITQ